jgi:hypothetical protein
MQNRSGQMRAAVSGNGLLNCAGGEGALSPASLPVIVLAVDVNGEARA